ncbi:Na+/H+ antiporter NhaA [Pseudomonas cichorii]|uniref:Na+/H+ antiporter NhaA n=1 Tax=Pseudomonas cichorii TaxID=36746 RepID=UPI001C8A5713|nr:Na+/H+ antiporter NhaA [Pseudomonas cichorii]MBX8515860.1 Na+/H+ antiporter NhaA [Pseudomonas cichorii]
MTRLPPKETPRAVAILARFLASESAGGIVLMGAALAALIVANSPLAPGYFAILHSVWLGLSVELWINDGLMAIFFLMVGLEIKREVLAGGLATWEQRALPGFAAAGGMLVPALIYLAVNWGNPQTISGWAIPAATDIAFALGVLSLLGKRVPTSLKVFLAALAILDDLGAVTIIAFFYSSGLNLPMLLASFVTLAVLVAMNRLKVRRLLPYLILGALLWFFVLQSGVHATLAGVALALCIPLGKPEEEARSPLLFLEEKLHYWVAFAIVPVFGFANAGVSLSGISAENLLDPVPLGVALGLFVGKQIGVFLAAWLAIRARLAVLPQGSNWVQLYGVALLCGIGFTMSLFIGNLAFPGAAHLVDEVKIGVLMGSGLAAIAGVLLLRSRFSRP